MKKYKYEKLIVDQNTPYEVLQLFKYKVIYNPIDGSFTNSETGKIYDGLNTKGYLSHISVRFNNIGYSWMPHRLAWFLIFNEVLPKSVQVDHINRIKTDNRLGNLRICSNSENQMNKPKITGNYKGVSWCKRSKKYSVTIAIHKQEFKIGRFRIEELTAQYYDSAARFYFKEFAYVNFSDEIIPTMSVEDLRKYKQETIYEKPNKSRTVYQYDLSGNFMREWESGTQAEAILNLPSKSICACCNGKRKTVNGFKWSYTQLTIS